MMLLIPIENSYICGEGHITDESEQCPCGSRSLFSLARILDRVPVQSGIDAFDQEYWTLQSRIRAEVEQELPSLKCLLEN